MTKQTEALKLALEGGGLYEITGRIEDIDKCIVHRSVLKEALAQPEQEPTNLERHERNVQKFLGTQQPKKPEQEPVAWLWELTGEVTTDPDRADGMWLPLYTKEQL